MTEEDFDWQGKSKSQVEYSESMTAIMITLFILTFIIALIFQDYLVFIIINLLNNFIMNKEQVLGILRHTLTFVGGFLITKGLVDDAQLTEISGALVTLVGAIWSVLSKK